MKENKKRGRNCAYPNKNLSFWMRALDNKQVGGEMAMAFIKTHLYQVYCRKKEKDKSQNPEPYKVIEISPPPKNLGIRYLPSNLQCGESVTIEDRPYTISAVTHGYQLRKGKCEPTEKRLDVLSTGRYILNLYLENLLEQS